MTIWAAFGAFTLTFATNDLAHGGGTDANGCHTNHKTGEYHCH
ncbi:YHYH domain-containing protein [Mesorhizobium sp. M0633]